MAQGMSDADRDRPVFSLILHPHRSLSPRAFMILMLSISAVSFVAGTVFLLMGAWPVFGFFGLDVLLIYLAFRFNFKSGRRCEIVEIVGGDIRVRQIDPEGREAQKSFEAYWSRPDIRQDKLYLNCRGESLEIGSFLIEEEKNDIKNELDLALYRFRNNLLVSKTQNVHHIIIPGCFPVRP